jgi:hypothetical protein
MARRKKFADLEHLREPEPPAPEPEPEKAEETGAEAAKKNLPESILQLQRVIGNRALSQALLERFSPASAPEAELPGPAAAALPGTSPRDLRVDAADLVGRSPAAQVSVFAAVAETLPAEAQQVLEEAKQGGPSGGTMGAALLKQLARSKLGPIPPGSGVKDAPALVDRLCEGVSSAWRQWQALAFFKNVIIQGPVAFHGELAGPPLGPFVLAESGASSAPELEAAQALAGALDQGMKDWQSRLKFPGLPLYPSFAAVPMPQAAPTPNIPVPVAALIAGALPPNLASARASDPGAQAVAQAVLDAITGGAFHMWAASTLVVNVLGHGPVPSFAPPYVPVGPVVGGTVLPVTGVLL